jgi:hypothetical protein
LLKFASRSYKNATISFKTKLKQYHDVSFATAAAAAANRFAVVGKTPAWEIQKRSL